MKSLAISVKERENVGKSSSKALRNQGKVPCVLYGGEKQVCFFAHENDLRKLVYTSDVFLVDLDIEGKKTRCVMQDIQFHPVTDKILHIDFLEVFDDKEVTVEIPVILQGMSPGVRNGGNLLFRRKKIDGKIWVYGLFSFVVLLFVIIGLTVPVSGAMVRYKTPAIPFMLVLFLLLIDQQKISKTKWGDKINSLLI